VEDQQERLRALIAALPGGAVFVVDHDLRYLIAEGEALASAGLSSATFAGKTVGEVLEPDLAACYTPLYRQALAGTPFAHDHEAHGRAFHSRGVPLRGADGQVYAALAVSYDITERRQVELALRRSEARLALAVACLALVEVDYRTQQAQLSPTAAALYGLGSDALSIPRTELHATFHPDDRAELARQVAQSLDPEGPGWFAHEHRVVWPDGEIRWLAVRKQIVFDHTTAPAQPVSALLVARDITARKHRELSLLFLAELQALLTRLSALDTILPAVGARLVEHLALSHCLFVEVGGAAETATVFYDHHAPAVPSLLGAYQLAAFHTAAEREHLAAGQPVRIADV
jgi:PAS domain S-box-containing protein